MRRLLTNPRWLQIWRAALLIGIVVLIHQQARWIEARRTSPISLGTAEKYFSGAVRVDNEDPVHGLWFVRNRSGETIGCLLTTSPETDAIIGYSGPNNLLIALDSSGAIAGVELLTSGDTPEHVGKVRADRGFWRGFIGWKPRDKPPSPVAGVAGATLTSFAVAEAIQRRLAGATPSLRFPDPVTLAELRPVFTNVVRIVDEPGRVRALDTSGRLLGFAVRTSPQADNVSGYRGPTECLVALAPDARTVMDVRVRRSYDTTSYVNRVAEDPAFLKSFVGRTIEQLAVLNFGREKIEGVSGATQTSFALAEGIKRRFAAELKTREQVRPWRPKPRDLALVAVISGALVISFTRLRGYRWVRVAWQLGLVGYVGLVNHDLLSLALLGGWAAHGVAWNAAPGLVLLAAAALLVPWATRRQLYCHQLCPHGAAQQLLGGIFRHRWTVPVKLMRVLDFIPGLLIAAALLSILAGLGFNLANLEPFDAWVWRAAGTATLVLAGVGLVASLFVSQAYCRFGCPTGAILNFVRSAGSGDRWGRRDWFALTLLVAGLLGVAAVRRQPVPEQPADNPIWHGRTMGTTWTVKTRTTIANPATIEKTIADEFETAESLTSHWRTNTPLARFNQARTTNAIALPLALVQLVRWSADISRATDGAFDITVGPLVRAWGFGPSPPRFEPPTDEEINTLLPATDWRKLETSETGLRKRYPGIEIDLSAIVPGWAIDQVAHALERRGCTQFLIESGGELRALGSWAIEIEHPERTCVLHNESIGTSGTYRQNWKSGERRYSHLINPHTGRPVEHHTVSVSVRHADCAQADAWAAALNVMGVETGLPLAEKLQIAAQFVVEDDEGWLRVRETAAWTARDTAARAAR